MTTVRSPAYLAGSKGAPCTFRIVGVCRDERDTTVPAHLRDCHTGRGIKASDLSVADGCFDCHNVMDRRAKLPSGKYITDDEWNFYALRALQETLERRVDMKLLIVVGNQADKERKPKPVAPRKPPEQRRKVGKGRPMESRSTFQPGRKIMNANRLRKPANH